MRRTRTVREWPAAQHASLYGETQHHAVVPARAERHGRSAAQLAEDRFEREVQMGRHLSGGPFAWCGCNVPRFDSICRFEVIGNGALMQSECFIP